MIRRTSLAAYIAIRESGALSAARWRVYDWLYHHGPATRNELDVGLSAGQPNPAYSRRLTELERMGVIARFGERPCSVSGFGADLWDVTDELPRKVEKPTPARAYVEAIRQMARDLDGGTDPGAFVGRWQDTIRQLGHEVRP